jgi:hypothetical protein
VSQEQIQPFLLFGQSAILAALAALVIEDLPGFTLAWPSYAVLGWIGLGCILAAGVLYVAVSRAGLRRLLGAALIIASLLPLWQYGSLPRLPRLFDLQFHSVTRLSEGASNKRVEWQPVRVTGIDPTNSNAALETQADNKPSSTRPTTTPTSPTKEEVRSQPPPSPSQNQELNKLWSIPCCQPR